MRPRRAAGQPGRQRRGLRRQSRLARAGGGPRAGRPVRTAGAGGALPGGRGASRPQAAADRGRRPGRRHRRDPGGGRCSGCGRGHPGGGPRLGSRRSRWSARRCLPLSGRRAGPRRPCWPRPAASSGRARPGRRGRLGRRWSGPRAAGPGGGRGRRGLAVGGVRGSHGCGDPLDEVVLRSYVTGAAHMALGWVCSEAIAVDEDGVPEDLTIRSFGILPARGHAPDHCAPSSRRRPTGHRRSAGSDAAFAAVAAAAWMAQGCRPGGRHRRAHVREGGSRWLAASQARTGIPRPVGPYTPVVRAGDWLVCSGQVGLRDGSAGGGSRGSGDPGGGQPRGPAAGPGSRSRASSRPRVFLTDIADYAAMNEAYIAAFGDHRPARSAFAVAGLPLGALVEIEAWAYVGA